MHLVLVRHAIAQDAAPGGDDAARALTPQGERKFRRVARGLDALGWRFSRVWTSPWLRATQTAVLLARVSDAEPVETELLARRPTLELLAQLAGAPEHGDRRSATAVVGHEPWLGELLAWLALGDPGQGDVFVLKKGGVAWLEGSVVPGGMKIRAIAPPRLLRPR